MILLNSSISHVQCSFGRLGSGHAAAAIKYRCPGRRRTITISKYSSSHLPPVDRALAPTRIPEGPNLPLTAAVVALRGVAHRRDDLPLRSAAAACVLVDANPILAPRTRHCWLGNEYARDRRGREVTRHDIGCGDATNRGRGAGWGQALQRIGDVARRKRVHGRARVDASRGARPRSLGVGRRTVFVSARNRRHLGRL